MPLPTPIFLTGFELGSILLTGQNATPNLVWDTGTLTGGTATMVSTNVFDGSWSLRLNKTSSSVLWIRRTTDLGGLTVMVGVIYFRIAAVAATTTQLFRVNTNATEDLVFGLDTSNRISVAIGAGTAQNSGTAISGATWYRVEFRFTMNLTQYTCDWGWATGNGDLARMTQALGSTGQASTTSVGFEVGSEGTATHDVQYDNIVLSGTSADYPMGPVKIEKLTPNADGTHALNAHITASGGGTTNLFQEVDDCIGTGTTDTTTYCNQGTIGTSDYAEFLFTDTTLMQVWGVSASVGISAAGTAANVQQWKSNVNNGTIADISTNASGGGTSANLRYIYKLVAIPSGGWTIPLVNGLRARWGYAGDVTPNPRGTSIVYEVCGPANVKHAPPFVKGQALQRASRW